jgi:hypothetical protein
MKIWDRLELDMWFERFKPERDEAKKRNTFDERFGIDFGEKGC